MPLHSFVEDALALAARGWLVFPIRPGQKLPATKNGFLDATTEPDQIRTWWTGQRKWVDRNIGVVTSRSSGIWVLDADIDPETGETVGENTLEDLQRVHGKFPNCPVSVTPKGGRHYVFEWPADGLDLPRKIKFQPGLDALGMRTEVAADGTATEKAGYFIAPPSVRGDGAYSWVTSPDEVSPPQAPQWLVDLVRAEVKSRPSDMPVYKAVRSDRTNAYGRKSLSELCSEIRSLPIGAQEVEFGRKAMRVASIAYGGNIDINEAFSAVMEAGMSMANQPGREPWTSHVLEKKARAVFAKAATDPSPLKNGQDRPARSRPQLVVMNQEREADPEPDPPKPEKPKSDRDWMKEGNGRWVWKDDDNLKPSALINAQLMVEFHPELRGMYRYDEFRDQVFIMRGLPGDGRDGYPRELNDQDETALAGWLNWHGLSPAISTVGSVIREVAFRSAFDPLREWVESLVWDGEPRVDGWLSRYAGVERSAYSSLVGTKFMIGAIARALDPGAKVDAMIVLEGAQNLGKSTLVRELCGPEMFSDQVGDVTNKDSSERIQGCWIVEIPEMDKFNRAEANSVKDFLSRREDRYRPAYGRNVIKRPRRTVFFGTINPDGGGYLKDTTGNRRFWPIMVKSIDLEGIRRDREQLWAEAKHKYLEGEEWWVSPTDAHVVEPEQEARRDDDVWEPKIRYWLENEIITASRVCFTSSDCLIKAIGLELSKQGQRDKIRVAKILKLLGCEDRNNSNGIRGRSWEYSEK